MNAAFSDITALIIIKRGYLDLHLRLFWVISVHYDSFDWFYECEVFDCGSKVGMGSCGWNYSERSGLPATDLGALWEHSRGNFAGFWGINRYKQVKIDF